MAMEDLDVVGPWPAFAGKTLERLVVQESWFEGERDDEANVVWLLVEGNWHKLYFDGDAVFWDAHSHGPDNHGTEAEDADFPLADLGERHGLAGKAIARCDGDYMDETSEVTLHFGDGTFIGFRNRLDHTVVVLSDGVASA